MATTRAASVLAILAVFFCPGVLPAADAPVFTLKDYIGRHWEHELVEYRLDPAAAKGVAGRRLVDSAGREVLYQLDGEKGTVAFQADIEPYATNQYTFTADAASAETDLTVRETDKYVEIANSLTGLRLVRSLPEETTQAPLIAWQLASGEWAGKTELKKAERIANCETVVTERGPVRARATCRIEFVNGDTWTVACELLAREPVIKVNEAFNCAERRHVDLVFSEGLPAAHALMRSSARHPIDGTQYPDGAYLARTLNTKDDRVLLLEPWVHWGGQPTRTSSFSLADAEWRNVVFMAASSPTRWVDPNTPKKLRAGVSQWVRRGEDGRLSMTFELAQGEREYLIGAVAGEVDRQNLEEKRRVPTQAQVHQMRYSDFPLDRVKDYTLAWESPDAQSTAFLSERDQAELLRNYRVEPRTLERLRRQKPTVHSTEEFIPCYLATKDEALERKLIDLVLANVRGRLNQISKLEQNVITLGYAPHHYRSFITTCSVLSTIYDSPTLTAEEREKLKGHLAFLAYVFNRDAFSSPVRGFAGFPNMTACVFGVRAALAGVLPGHPMQAKWMRKATQDLKEMFLSRWAYEDGSFRGDTLESLHYTQLIYDIVLGVLYRAYSSGVDRETLFHPGVKNIGQWYAAASTPPDVRIRNWRHTPPVGHVYKFEVTPAIFAMLAFMFREHDPEFAGHMKWMQLQQGNEYFQAVGGFVPSFAGYRKLFMANGVSPKTPRYESRHWTGTSVILRNHYAHPLENMLYLIAGGGHSHYDQDSGSITLWGKGEIIADDFGYYGYAPGEDQSMIDSPVADPRQIMHVAAFRKGAHIDYVRGKKDAWTRRAFLVKHDEPEGPNYYVIHDALSVKAPAHWRLWLTAEDAAVDGTHVLSTGLDRVNTEIHFAALPPGGEITTSEKTRTPYGLNSQGKYRGRVPTTQTGLAIHSPKFKRLLTLVYPRLKSEEAPVVTPIADGHGFKLTTPFGTDYVFLSDRPATYAEGKLTFDGTAAFARVTGGKAVLDLIEPGEIAFGEQRLVKQAPKSEAKSNNIIPDGELNTGAYTIFPQQPRGSQFDVTLLDSPEDLAALGLRGRYCQKIVCLDTSAKKWRRVLPLTKSRVYVDPDKTYRVRARVHIPAKNRVFLSSYGQNAKRRQIRSDKGRTWAWSLGMHGPTNGFTDFETTLGPKGKAVGHTFPPSIVVLPSVHCRVYDKGNGLFYIEDLVIEEVVEE